MEHKLFWSVVVDLLKKMSINKFLFLISFLVHPEWFEDDEDVNNGPNDHVMLIDNKRPAIEGIWVSDDGKYVCGLRIEDEDPQMDLHGGSEYCTNQYSLLPYLFRFWYE